MNGMIKERDAAEALGVSVSTLRRWRCLGTGPVFRKFNGAVRYAQSDLQKFIENRAHVATLPRRRCKDGNSGKVIKQMAANLVSSFKERHRNGSV